MAHAVRHTTSGDGFDAATWSSRARRPIKVFKQPVSGTAQPGRWQAPRTSVLVSPSCPDALHSNASACASVSWVSAWAETRISTPSPHAKTRLIESSTRSALLTSTFSRLLCLRGSFLPRTVSAEMSVRVFPASLVQPCLETHMAFQ